MLRYSCWEEPLFHTVREDSVEDAEDVRVRMLRSAVEKSAGPSQYMKCLLLDVIETYFVLEGEDAENYRDLVSREENHAVRDFERTWGERLMLTGFFEGKRQTLKRQLTSKFGPLPSGVEGRIDAIAAEDVLDGYLEGLITASSLVELGLEG